LQKNQPAGVKKNIKQSVLLRGDSHAIVHSRTIPLLS